MKKRAGDYSKSWQPSIAMMMTVLLLVPGSELLLMVVHRTLFHLAVSWSELIKLLNMKSS